MILIDSPEAATPCTLSGWRSAAGRFFDDERAARYDGCSHVRCQYCEAPTPKSYLSCDACRDKRDREKFDSREARAWDGKQMVYCEDRDEYFSSPGDALDDWEKDAPPRLVLCEPTFARAIDSSLWEDDLPGEEREVPDWLEELVSEFNRKLEGKPELSWHPGEYRLLA